MTYPLDFQIQHRYRTLESGIEIPAALRSGVRTALCQAKVDTGSALCLFQRELAEMLGLEVESGYRRELSTLTSGGLIAYGHSVTLHTLGVEFESFVYFAADYHLPRNLLGRDGWLQKVRLAVIDYVAELYLSPYAAG
jgi:hypothetical protein